MPALNVGNPIFSAKGLDHLREYSGLLLLRLQYWLLATQTIKRIPPCPWLNLHHLFQLLLNPGHLYLIESQTRLTIPILPHGEYTILLINKGHMIKAKVDRLDSCYCV